MRDTGKVLLTFVGSILFCTALVGTIQALRDGVRGDGDAIGGIIMGIGLSMLIMPWLRDERADVPRAAEPVDLPERIDAR